MQATEIEALWRRKYEAFPAVVCLAATAAVLLVPEFFLLSPLAAAFVAAGVGSIGCWRTYQTLELLQRHRNLLAQPRFLMTPDDIPVSDDKLYLGKGFLWTRQHAQRLHDLNGFARDFISLETSAAERLDGWPWLHGLEINESDISMKTADRSGHTLVLGTTGVGKTRLMELLVSQDIRRGDTVIVFDPKGDADLLKRIYIEANKSGRLDDLYVFHLGFPEYSTRYNPVGDFGRLTEVATRIAEQLPGEGQSAAFKEFAWNYVNRVCGVFQALGHRPSYHTLKKTCENLDPLISEYYRNFLDKNHPNWKDAFQTFKDALKNPDDKSVFLPREMKARDFDAMALVLYVQAHGLEKDDIILSLESIVQYERSYYEKLVASLGPLLEKLTTGQINAVLSPDYEDHQDPRPIINWSDILNRRGIVYFALDTLTDPTVGEAVGASIFADLKSTAGTLYKEGHEVGFPESGRRRSGNIIVHADEMNEIAGPEVTGLLNKGRGAGFQLTLYTQTMQDLIVRLKTRAAAEQQIGNLNTLIMLRPQNTDTAELLTKTLPETEVFSVTTASFSESQGSGEFESSRTEDKVSSKKAPLLAPSTPSKLPKGNAFALISGHLFKIRIPLIEREDVDEEKMDIPTIMQQLIYRRRRPRRHRQHAQHA